MVTREVLHNFERYAKETEERVNYGIEHYRKGDFCITVTDAEGKAVPNTEITLTQKTHEFKYGANIFMLDEMESEEKNEKYKKYFAEAFNMATVPFYWCDLEPEKGKPRYDKNSPKIYRRPAPDLCIEFCKEHGIEPREHALAYDAYYPEWVKVLPVEGVKKELTERYRQISERYADLIPTIEVTNEMENWDNDRTSAFYNDDENIEWCFKLAEKYFPNNHLSINESTQIWNQFARNRDPYYLKIERALQKGARIDAVGLQYHMFHSVDRYLEGTKKTYDPRHIFRILDRYSDFKLPLQLTEVTIPAFSDSPEDEQLQAEIIRTLYRIWFSHEYVEQIVYWNLVDGYAAFIKQGDMTGGENVFRGGLMRYDLTPKPAYFVIKDLFEKEWRTNVKVVTDENGVAHFRGFFGGYEANIDGQIYSIDALKNLRRNNAEDRRIYIQTR